MAVTIGVNRKQKVGKNADAIIGDQILPVIDKYKNSRGKFEAFKAELIQAVEKTKHASNAATQRTLDYINQQRNFNSLLMAAYSIQLGGCGLGMGKDSMGKQSLRNRFR